MWWCAMALGADQQVLLVGNSYTARNDLRSTLQSGLQAHPDWQGATVRAVAVPGATLAEHARRATGDDDDWQQTLALSWDVVVFQDQSQVPGFPDDHPARVDSIAGLQTLLELVSADRVVLFQTWGRRDGDRDNPERYATFPAMQDHLTAGYAAYAEVAGGAEVAPVGEVFRDVHGTDQALHARLYETDGSHPSPLGSYAVATTLVRLLAEGDPAVVPVPFDEPVADEVEGVRAAVRRVLPAAEEPPAPPRRSGCATTRGGAWLGWLPPVFLLGRRRL